VKLIFAGTPEFARVALAQLHAGGHQIALVLTQPDRPAGRGLKLKASPVKQFALDQSIPLAQPRSLRLDGKYPEDARLAYAAMQAVQADAMVVAAYGLILPLWTLDLPERGCFNIHASLLPRWRGAAPLQRAIQAGDTHSGITIMYMDAGLDTGEMLLAQALPITPEDTCASLHDKLAPLGGRLMLEALAQLADGSARRVPQPDQGVTYAHKLDKSEAAIDWSQTAPVISCAIRALNPAPGASSRLNGETLKIWHAEIAPGAPPQAAECGSILAVTPVSIAVAAMNSIVNIVELQRPGGKRLALADFLRGFDLHTGMVFEQPAAALPQPALAAPAAPVPASAPAAAASADLAAVPVPGPALSLPA
jgi:methionyl-tRNA formyltransferase